MAGAEAREAKDCDCEMAYCAFSALLTVPIVTDDACIIAPRFFVIKGGLQLHGKVIMGSIHSVRGNFRGHKIM
jgi:hypothetical protein